jgi:hypothetical protein
MHCVDSFAILQLHGNVKPCQWPAAVHCARPRSELHAELLIVDTHYPSSQFFTTEYVQSCFVYNYVYVAAPAYTAPVDIAVRRWNLNGAVASGSGSAASSFSHTLSLRHLAVSSFKDLRSQVAAVVASDAHALRLTQSGAAAGSSALSALESSPSLLLSSSASPTSAAAADLDLFNSFFLYYITDQDNWFGTRVGVQSEKDLAAYIEFRGSAIDSTPLLVWLDSNSPQHLSSTNCADIPIQQSSHDSSSATSTTKSSRSHSSGSSEWTVGAEFSANVRYRDNFECVVCSFRCEFNTAAHVYPADDMRPYDGLLADAGIAHPYVIANGLTLCPRCYSPFVDGLFYINPVNSKSIIASQRLIDRDPAWQHYRELNPPASGLSDERPGELVLRVQQRHFEYCNAQFTIQKTMYPHECPRCLDRFVGPVTKEHANSCQGFYGRHRPVAAVQAAIGSGPSAASASASFSPLPDSSESPVAAAAAINVPAACADANAASAVVAVAVAESAASASPSSSSPLPSFPSTAAAVSELASRLAKGL